MSNVCRSRLDTNGIDHMLDNTVSASMSGWFVDSDVLLSSSNSDNDEIYRPCKGESESETDFSDSRKGHVAMQGEITLPELDIGDADNDGEDDEDGSVTLVIFSAFQNKI